MAWLEGKLQPVDWLGALSLLQQKRRQEEISRPQRQMGNINALRGGIRTRGEPTITWPSGLGANAFPGFGAQKLPISSISGYRSDTGQILPETNPFANVRGGVGPVQPSEEQISAATSIAQDQARAAQYERQQGPNWVNPQLETQKGIAETGIALDKEQLENLKEYQKNILGIKGREAGIKEKIARTKEKEIEAKDKAGYFERKNDMLSILQEIAENTRGTTAGTPPITPEENTELINQLNQQFKQEQFKNQQYPILQKMSPEEKQIAEGIINKNQISWDDTENVLDILTKVHQRYLTPKGR